MAAAHSHAQPDPYRSLFHQLASAAAHCRVVVEDDRVVDVVVVDGNAAFRALRDLVPALWELLGRARAGARETAQLRAEGRVLSATAYPTGGDDVMVVIEDVTAHEQLRGLNRELEHRAQEHTQALEASNRDLEAFGSSVSHDLRAPLRAIHGFSAILLEDFAAELPEEAKGLLTRIHAGGCRLRDLVEELVKFSRLGRGELRRARVDLDAMVRGVLDELLAGRALGDRLVVRVAPLGTCHADPSLLTSVWMNLLDNALKYTRTRERILIEVGREVRDGEVVYYVRDNGVGFDMAYAERLFGVFQRLHAASDFEGTGIGLANVRRIIERHSGRVAAMSELGRGARFEFTLGIADPVAR